MGRVVFTSERGIVTCMVRDCPFVFLDDRGTGMEEAIRHADETGHQAVQVRIDAVLIVAPDIEEDVDDEEKENDDLEIAEVVAEGDCENCDTPDTELYDWHGMAVCSDCLALAQSGGLI